MTTKPQQSVLDQLASPKAIDLLYAEDALSPQARLEAHRLIGPARNWELWVSRLSLFYGVTLALSGLIFFFAYNWSALSPLTKLTIPQGFFALTLCATLYKFDTEQLGYKILILACSVLVGLMLAVYGQVYQTGADSYQLFLTWALLILPWVLWTRFAALWLLWIALFNLSATLYWDIGITDKNSLRLLMVLGLVNALFLGAREMFMQQRIWLQSKWIRITLTLLVLSFLTWLGFGLIVNNFNKLLSVYTFEVGYLILFHLGLIVFYRYKMFDLETLSLTLLSLTLFIEALFIRVITDSNLSDIGKMSSLVVVTTVLFGLTTTYLLKTNKLKKALL